MLLKLKGLEMARNSDVQTVQDFFWLVKSPGLVQNK